MKFCEASALRAKSYKFRGGGTVRIKLSSSTSRPHKIRRWEVSTGVINSVPLPVLLVRGHAHGIYDMVCGCLMVSALRRFRVNDNVTNPFLQPVDFPVRALPGCHHARTHVQSLSRQGCHGVSYFKWMLQMYCGCRMASLLGAGERNSSL